MQQNLYLSDNNIKLNAFGLHRTDGHLQSPLLRLVPADEAGCVYKDAVGDLRNFGEFLKILAEKTLRIVNIILD